MGTFVQDGHPPPPTGVVVNPRHRLSRGLILLWTMNQISGRRIFDASGNGNDGILDPTDIDPPEILFGREDGVSTRPWSSPQLLSTSGGNNERIPVSIPRRPRLIGPNHTFVLRVFPRAILGFHGIWGKHTGSSGFLFFQSADEFQVFHNGSIVIASAGFFNHFIWVHIGVVFRDGLVTLYKNGVKLSDASGLSPMVDNTKDLLLGAQNDVSGRQFIGNYREVMIFNRSLSALEINELYQDPFGLFWDPGPIPVRFKPVVVPVIPALIQKLSRGPVSTNIYVRTTTAGSRPARTI